jgi:predicted metal-binding protein
MQSDIFFTTTGLMHVAFLFAANQTQSKYKEFFQLARFILNLCCGHCHGGSGLRSPWRFGSQGDDENQL